MSTRLTRITTTILLSFQHYNYFSPLWKRRKGNKNLCIITIHLDIVLRSVHFLYKLIYNITIRVHGGVLITCALQKSEVYEVGILQNFKLAIVAKPNTRQTPTRLGHAWTRVIHTTFIIVFLNGHIGDTLRTCMSFLRTCMSMAMFVSTRAS